MTRIFQTGWEIGDVAAFGTIVVAGNGSSRNPTVVASTPTPRINSSYCLRCGWISDTNQNDGGDKSAWHVAHSTETDVWYSFGFQISSDITSEDAATYSTIFRCFDSAGNCQLVLRYDAGTLRLYRANATTASPTQAQLTSLGSSASSITNLTWYLIEVHMIPATGATGTAEVWVNGVQVINATSVVTANANANTAAAEVSYYRLQGSANAGRTTIWAAFDDFRINNTSGSVNNGRPGDESVRLLVGTSAGDSTQWSRGGADSGSNYGQTDETPPNDATDYVTGAAVGDLDLYNTTDFPISAISAISVVAKIANSDGSGGTIYLPTKTGAGQSDGTAKTLTASWAYANRLLETDPADSNAWSAVKLAALQIGVKVAS